jgi:hypothetical protein
VKKKMKKTLSLLPEQKNRDGNKNTTVMKQSETLILLVSSLTKAEKKKFTSNRRETDYAVLFDIIGNGKNITAKELKREFEKKCKNACFNATVTYLHKVLLDGLLELRQNQDSHYHLFSKIMKARIMFEKSLFEAALDMLQQVKEEAMLHENYCALLYASRLELEYLLFLNMPGITETELINKHFRISETLKNIRKVNEQSALYELLKHRLIYGGYVRSQKQKDAFNDLVISEMSINSSNRDSFEIKKLHQLFQSDYLTGIGERESAFLSFRELNRLFENNRRLWANPPFYYVSMIEGILDNLRNAGHYSEMAYFIAQLKQIRHPSTGFQIHVAALIFLYELFPLLDRGDFQASAKLAEHCRKNVLENASRLSMMRKAEISFCLALIHIGLQDFKKAQHTLVTETACGNNFRSLPLCRSIRMVHLIIHYELGNQQIVNTECRSIKREISKTGNACLVEQLMLSFLGKGKTILYSAAKRKKLLLDVNPQFIDIKNNIFEKQILKNFDFLAWIESKLAQISLSDALRRKFEIIDN